MVLCVCVSSLCAGVSHLWAIGVADNRATFNDVPLGNGVSIMATVTLLAGPGCEGLPRAPSWCCYWFWLPCCWSTRGFWRVERWLGRFRGYYLGARLHDQAEWQESVFSCNLCGCFCGPQLWKHILSHHMITWDTFSCLKCLILLAQSGSFICFRNYYALLCHQYLYQPVLVLRNETPLSLFLMLMLIFIVWVPQQRARAHSSCVHLWVPLSSVSACGETGSTQVPHLVSRADATLKEATCAHGHWCFTGEANGKFCPHTLVHAGSAILITHCLKSVCLPGTQYCCRRKHL